jgi:hypothetical protein
LFEISPEPLVALFICTLTAQYSARSWLDRIELLGARLAEHKRAVVFGAALVSIIGRLLLLHWVPIPIASIHDEASYLLASDTFAHGRLANPPHPMWVFLDTFHVLQHPTYASAYPPAQGMVLALGQVLGHPWIGVLLSMAAMCATVTWALQQWLPARWALLGSVLVILRVGLMSYWVDSYWGGTVAAIGGGLVIGALPTLLKRPTVPNSVLMGVGASLLANSRPVEGFLFFLPAAVLLGARLFSTTGNRLRQKAMTLLFPTTLVLVATTAFMGYYNWRVTGDAILFPHVLQYRLFGNPAIFVWQHASPPLHYDNPQFTAFFVYWNQSGFLQRSWARLSLTKCHDGWGFFLGPAYSIPFLTLPWLIFDRRIRFLIVQALWCGIWALMVIWFEPHYLAPLTATIFVIVVQAIRHLRQWTFKGYPTGVFASRLIMVMAVARIFLPGAVSVNPPFRGWNLIRSQITQQLQVTSQKHLIIVRYTPNHDVLHEWVYNAADIDSSKVVWAREIPGRDLRPLLDYYRDRKVWLVEADAAPPHLEAYDVNASDTKVH